MTRRLSALLAAFSIAFALVGGTGPARTASAAREDFAHGIIVDTTDARSMRAAHELGFGVAKMMLHWASVEPSPGNYVWKQTKENDFDNIMKPARAEGMKLVVRVDGVPGFAGGSPANANLDAVRSFYEEVARYGAGTVIGYEILNEPNLDREWGGAPNAHAYTAFLRAAYQGIKAGDPSALVLGGGPAPGTGNNPGATIEDVDFLNGMYDAGAKDVMDALSVHNYGGNTAPETDPSDCLICFRRAEVYRDVMVRRGDGDKTIWLTEWGYLMDAGQHMGQYDWMKVSADVQADYLVRAYRYALEHWPWLGGSLLFNIDGAASPYQNYGGFDAKAWFSIMNSDYSPRPAYDALRGLNAEIAAATSAARKPAARQPRPAAPPAARPADPAPAPVEEVAAPSPPAEEGVRLQVAGTDGTGVNLRAEPSSDAQVLRVVPEGEVLVGVGGPRSAGGLSWHRVRDRSGSSGWVASKYVQPI